jgi:hypothetical protein
VTSARRTSETASGYSLPTPVKYDTGGRGEGDNYHGLGWQARYVGDVTGPAGKYPKGFRPSEVVTYPTPGGDEDPAPVATDGVTANSTAARRAVFPTPTAMDARDKQSKAPPSRVRFTSTGMPEADRESGSGAQLSLAQAAHVADNRSWPTPLAGARKMVGPNFNIDEPRNGIAAAVRREIRDAHLPTPTSQNGLRDGSQSEHHPGKWQSPGHPEYGELNPDWVEWLMGWPRTWTSLEPMNLDELQRWQEENTTPIHIDGMRGVRDDEKPATASQRPRPRERAPGEHSNSVSNPSLPRALESGGLGGGENRTGRVQSVRRRIPTDADGQGSALQSRVSAAVGEDLRIQAVAGTLTDQWLTDPSDDAGRAMGKTVPKPATKELEGLRQSRIAALGNGQVSAVAAAAFLHLWSLPWPEGRTTEGQQPEGTT